MKYDWNDDASYIGFRKWNTISILTWTSPNFVLNFHEITIKLDGQLN